MKRFSKILAVAVLGAHSLATAQESNGLAPEVTDLNAADVSFQLEAKLPDLKKPWVDTSPPNLKDGIAVGELGIDGGDKEAILKFTAEIADGVHGEVDSFLLFQDGKLLLESYYRRGRVNFPHYQMSITKSYTSMALGRAIQLGHLQMGDLDNPFVSFLENLDPGKHVSGADKVTLAEAMNMRSGIRIDSKSVKALMRKPNQLAGQGQIQTYLENSAPISPETQTFKYQGSDPSITMQVLEASVPTSASEFIKTEVLGKMGITSYGWQSDISGLPKSAAGSSMRSRDMVKWGMLTMNGGKWNGEQLISPEFVEKATAKIHTNAQKTSYGFFWWRHEVKIGERTFDCKSGRGAGGQFILMFPELDLIMVITAHQKGMGKMLKTAPEQILPAFIQ